MADAAGAGRPDWDTIFADYQSVVDYPGCRFWRELSDYYPNAKVIHTVRDPDDWFDSTQATIFAAGGASRAPPPALAPFFNMLLDEFADRIDDRAFMTDYFRRHTEAVKRAIAPERLLVYQAGDGWEPLCAFLQTPVPESPYPMVNSRQEFASHVRSAGGDPTKLGQDFSSRPRA